MACESHTIEAMVRGYHMYRETWLATVGKSYLACEKWATIAIRSLWYSGKIRSCRQSCPKKDIVGVLDVFS